MVTSTWWVYDFEPVEPPSTDLDPGEKDHYMMGDEALLQYFREFKWIEELDYEDKEHFGTAEAPATAKNMPMKFTTHSNAFKDGWIITEDEYEKPPQGGKKESMIGHGYMPGHPTEIPSSKKPEGAQTSAEIFDFLDPKNNMAVRAFRSTRGAGLAGVITSLSLAYDDALWGTSAEDKTLRVPKKVNVTMNFSPMHDFPLGLDYMGRMIAPSHPAGPWHATKQLALAKEGEDTLAEKKTFREEVCAVLPPREEWMEDVLGKAPTDE